MKAKFSVVAAAGAVALLAAGASAAPAAAKHHQPEGRAFPQYVVTKGNKATIFGNYKCWGGDGTLWASLKQGGHGDLTAEGSSSTARSWFDVHIPLNCNGDTHVVKAVITKQVPNDGHPKAYKQLRNGTSYIQWCVTDSTFDGTSESGLSSYSTWLDVVRAGHSDDD